MGAGEACTLGPGARERAKKQHGKPAEEAVCPPRTQRQVTPKYMTHHEKMLKRARAEGYTARTATTSYQ